MSLNDFFNDLANNASRNYKIEKLEANKTNELLREVIRLTLDPFTLFYIKKIPSPIFTGKVISLEEAIGRLYTLSSREKTGNDAIKFLAELLGSVNTADSEVIRRIISKDLKCGVSTSTVNKVWTGLVNDYPVMLCSPFEQKIADKIKYPAIAQEKSDGMRFNAVVDGDKCNFYSRSGQPLELLGNLQEEFITLANGISCVFDGELLVIEGDKILPRKEGNGILNKANKGTISPVEASKVQARIWDVIPYMYFLDGEYSKPYSDRVAVLDKMLETNPVQKIEMIEWRLVHSLEEANTYFQEKLDAGFEGIILKDLRGIWENKRTKTQIKFKAEKDCDMKIVGLTEGTGKYEGMLGSIECESEDGLIKVSVGSGFNDKDRVDLFTNDIIGKVVSVQYNELIKNRQGELSLFLPIYIELRLDKTEADSSTKIK